MKLLLILLFLGGLLVAAVLAAVSLWSGLADVEISINGYLALGLGVVLTFLLGAGLMALVFYSARHGHDEGKDGSGNGPGGGL